MLGRNVATRSTLGVLLLLTGCSDGGDAGQPDPVGALMNAGYDCEDVQRLAHLHICFLLDGSTLTFVLLDEDETNAFAVSQLRDGSEVVVGDGWVTTSLDSGVGARVAEATNGRVIRSANDLR